MVWLRGPASPYFFGLSAAVVGGLAGLAWPKRWVPIVVAILLFPPSMMLLMHLTDPASSVGSRADAWVTFGGVLCNLFLALGALLSGTAIRKAQAERAAALLASVSKRLQLLHNVLDQLSASEYPSDELQRECPGLVGAWQRLQGDVERMTREREQTSRDAEIGREVRQIVHDLKPALGLVKVSTETLLQTNTSANQAEALQLLKLASERMDRSVREMLTIKPKSQSATVQGAAHDNRIREAVESSDEHSPLAKTLTPEAIAARDGEWTQAEIDALRARATKPKRKRTIDEEFRDLVAAVGATVRSIDASVSLIITPEFRQVGRDLLVHSSGIERVLIDLTKNAAEACIAHPLAPGMSREVILGARIDSSSCLVSITDTGVGMSPKEQRYYGHRGYTSGKIDGSGLGVAHAVEWTGRQGGFLRCRSLQDYGTTVELWLPYTRAPGVGQSSGVSPLQN